MNRNIIKKSIYLLKNKVPFVIATIINSLGSTPRSSGSTMIIEKNGNIFETIGGGALEAKLIKITPRILIKKRPYLIKMDLNSKMASNLGMVCGGSSSIIICPILYDTKIQHIFEYCYNKNRQSLLALEFHKKKKKNYCHVLYEKKDLIQIYPERKSKEFLFLTNNYQKIFSRGIKFIDLKNKIFTFLPINNSKKLFIFGAGHIARSISKIATILNFKVIIIDDRRIFANRRRFTKASKIKIINFNLFNLEFKNIDKQSFVVIVTRGHIYDQKILEQILLTKAKYIGMIGSSLKKKSIFNKLKQKGFTSKNLKRIHSPIGIRIGSETPEEIALSILAEIILINSKKIIKTTNLN